MLRTSSRSTRAKRLIPTTFFWGNDGTFIWDGGNANTYYGAHPYPIPAPSGPGQWEISVYSNDYVTGTEVQWDRWYTQVFRAWRESSSITHHEFYWDWPDTTKVISRAIDDPNWAQQDPPTPAIVIGQAPDLNGASWGGYPGWEEFKGVIRGIQLYAGLLSLTDVQAELNAPQSTTAGQNLIWYLNRDPRPGDVTDKKGTGTPHNPLWDGTTALQWQGRAFSLRFYGHGSGQIDRVKIPIDAPARPADIGSGDFTIEFWMKANGAENGAGNCIAGKDGWINGNILLDRDIYFAGDYGDFGIALFADGLAFGVADSLSGGGLCGATDVADGLWHHVAATRDATTGELRLFVDGQLDGSSSGPAGNVSYRDGRSTSFANDPFLVLGAEKHDAGPAYPSYSGFLDELRLSTVIRYATNFTPPVNVFSADADTAALYHFDEGAAGPCTASVTDSSSAVGGPSDGACLYGGSAPAGPIYSTDTPALAGPFCPNGNVDPGEECDDNNTTNGDGCDNNCTVTACGNGIATAGEACDDGNLVAGDGCEPDCSLTPYALITGKRLLVRDRTDNAGRRRITFLSRDPGIAAPARASAGDPRNGGAVLQIARGVAEIDRRDLPASGWRGLGKPSGAGGYRYRDPTQARGPCTRALLKNARLLAVCKGDQIGFTLDEPSQGALAATFAPGVSGVRFCTVFDDVVVRDTPASVGVTGYFRARDAGVPASCPVP